MTGQKFELSDISGERYNSDAQLTMSSERKSGCFIKSSVGLALAFFVLLLVVAVGVIVFFAADSKNIECNCATSSVTGPNAEAITDQCVQLAQVGNEKVCSKCPPKQPPTGASPAPTPAETPKPKVTDVRLSAALEPIHYDVELQPYMHHADPKDFTFRGSVRAQVKCITATDNVTLHINVLKVDHSSIQFSGLEPSTSDPSFVNVEMDEDRQFIIFNLNKNMEVGKHYIIQMNYTSVLKDDLTGLYYSSYNRNNSKVYLAVTQLQPTDARKTFPCMDEPALKATFNITLVRPASLKSFSNTDIIDSSRTWVEDGRTYVADVYGPTPKMSTYLLAFVVCDFDYTTAVSANNVTYRSIARPEAYNSTKYALMVGSEILTYFENYFEVPYPLPKQDMMAVPDFSAGAMENWGLIIYRETAMLFTPGVSNEKNRERVAIVVSHELAHQWFGDLVTPAWWDDLWLNEGFASFVEYLGVDHVHPEWKLFDSFVTSDLQDVFDFDGLISSHPVYVPVGHPDEINEIFDRISYAKGGSIIRMMRHFLGYETFRLGLKLYLNRHKYGAATHNDLWQALTEQSKKDGKNVDVKSIMDTWTLQMNYPVVTVTRDFNNRGKLYVEQERFLKDSSAMDPGVYTSPYGYRWSIPLTFTSSKDPNFNETELDIYWMYKEEHNKAFDLGAANLPSSGGWFLANVQQNGFYRVNYQEGNWRALATQLKTDHTLFPVITRTQIINDAWSLANSGNLNVQIALEVMEYLKDETSHIVWNAATKQLNFVDDMLSLTPSYGHYMKFLATTITKAYTSLESNTGKSHLDEFARSKFTATACYAELPSCINEAKKQYTQWMNTSSNNPIDPIVRTTFYCAAIRHGGADEWNFALEMYKGSSDANERAKLLRALACSNEPWILNNFLYIVMAKDSVIRKQDALGVVSSVSYNVVGRPLAWNLFKSQYDTLKSRFGSSIFAWSRVIKALGTSFNTQYELDELKAFMEVKKDNLGSGKRSFEQAIEKTNFNMNWMANNSPAIKTWLEKVGN